MMSTKAIFGGIIACVLLALYVYLVWVAISTIYCVPQPECRSIFNERMASALALIGGLVSALVIAELAITKPGDAPAARAFVGLNLQPSLILKIVTLTYLAVWICVGLAAFVVGLQHDNTLQALTDLGQSWLGLAVAAAYSYFGIQPK